MIYGLLIELITSVFFNARLTKRRLSEIVVLRGRTACAVPDFHRAL